VKALALGRKFRMDGPRFGLGPQIVVVVLLLALLGALAIEPTRHLLAQRERIAGMTTDLQQIQRSNDRLEARMQKLRDPDFVEQRAREMGLARPGEIAFVVTPPSKGVQERQERRAEARKPKPVSEDPGLIEGFLMFIGLR
jgi:cell division protein FtsB